MKIPPRGRSDVGDQDELSNQNPLRATPSRSTHVISNIAGPASDPVLEELTTEKCVAGRVFIFDVIFFYISPPYDRDQLIPL